MRWGRIRPTISGEPSTCSARSGRREARSSSCCPSCSGRAISASPRTRASSSLRKRCRGRAPRRSRRSRQSSKITLVASLFEKRARRPVSTTRRPCSTQSAAISASIARCTSLTIRGTTRSSTSRPATWASKRSTRLRRSSACSSAGTSGIPRPRASRRCRARRSCSTRPRSAGIPRRRTKYGERQHEAWETVQRSHAIANGCFVVAVNRTGFEPDPRGSGGIEFWGQSFLRCARRPRHRARADRARGGARRRDRSRRDRREPHRLALPPRPAHRRLRRHHAAIRRRVRLSAEPIGLFTYSRLSFGVFTQHPASRKAQGRPKSPWPQRRRCFPQPCVIAATPCCMLRYKHVVRPVRRGALASRLPRRSSHSGETYYRKSWGGCHVS